MAHWSDTLVEKYHPCEDAVKLMLTFKTPAQAWKKCKRGDWMLWLLGKMSGPSESESRRKLVLCACACARTSLKYVKKGEDRPRIAIETTEKWARGEEGVTMGQVRCASASAAAYASASADAYASASASAAYAAASAYAYASAYASAYAAAAYASAYARKKALSKCADIVRKHYPVNPMAGENKGGAQGTNGNAGKE